MKNIFLVSAFTAITLNVTAQNNTSTVHFRLDSGMPLIVHMDGKINDKSNTVISYHNVPLGNHHVKIYRFSPYQNQKGGSAKLLFSGNISVAKEGDFDAILYTKERYIRLQNNETLSTPNQVYQEGTTPNPYSDIAINESVINNPGIQKLLQQMKLKEKDVDKLPLVTHYLEENTFTCSELSIILNGLLFDDNKMEIIEKYAAKVSDPQHMKSLVETLTLEENKKTILQLFK